MGDKTALLSCEQYSYNIFPVSNGVKRALPVNEHRNTEVRRCRERRGVALCNSIGKTWAMFSAVGQLAEIWQQHDNMAPICFDSCAALKHYARPVCVSTRSRLNNRQGVGVGRWGIPVGGGGTRGMCVHACGE